MPIQFLNGETATATPIPILVTAMFIALVGTRSSGKSTVQDYLVVHKGFIPLHLEGYSVRERKSDTINEVCRHVHQLVCSAMLSRTSREPILHLSPLDLRSSV
jgi:hypothetical protein